MNEIKKETDENKSENDLHVKERDKVTRNQRERDK